MLLFLLVRGTEDFIIGVVYLPPNSAEEVYAEYGLAVEELSLQYPDSRLFICGDYNVRGAGFFGDRFSLGENSEKYSLMSGSLHLARLTQICGIPNSHGTYLDLVFTNSVSAEVMMASDPLQAVGLHHTGLQFSISTASDCSAVVGADEVRQFYFNRGDYAGLNDFLASVDWNFIGEDICASVSKFYDILYSGLDRFIPMKSKKCTKFPVCFSGELIRMVSVKRKDHKKNL